MLKTLLLMFLCGILFAACWPFALFLLIAWPFLWLLSIPFRIFAAAMEAMVALLRAILFLPARILGYRGV